MLERLPPFVDEVIVVDGASTDNTVEVVPALAPAARIVVQPGRGKGDAVRAGLDAATGDRILLMDADGSHAPEELERLVAGLGDGYDVVHGSRFLPGGGSSDLTLVRRAGNHALTRATNLLHRSEYTDVCYGLMGLTRATARRLKLESWDIIVEAEMLCRIADLGCSVLEVPSFEHRRLSGASHFNGLRIGLKNLAIIVKTALEERPPRTSEADPVRSGTAPGPS